MNNTDVFKIGDKVIVDLFDSQTGRRGVIEKLPDPAVGRGRCYLVRFKSGRTAYLSATEFKHVDAVERLGDLADDQAQA